MILLVLAATMMLMATATVAPKTPLDSPMTPPQRPQEEDISLRMRTTAAVMPTKVAASMIRLLSPTMTPLALATTTKIITQRQQGAFLSTATEMTEAGASAKAMSMVVTTATAANALESMARKRRILLALVPATILAMLRVAKRRTLVALR